MARRVKQNPARRKPIKKRTVFVVMAMLNLTWYTVAVLWLSWQDHIVPSELTIAWFGAWTVELALLAGLKVKGKSPSDEGE